VLIVTGTIGLLHLPHSIAGNVEVLFGLLVSSYAITLTDYAGFRRLRRLRRSATPLVARVFVALLKYGHVVRGAE